MKHSRRIISFLAAFAVSVSFASCKNNEESSRIAEEEPEVTEEVPVEEPEEKGQEYKLTSYYEEIPLADMTTLTGDITDILYGGGHMYALTDDVAYTSGTGYVLCNIELATMKRSEIYNAPEGYVYRSDDPAGLPDDFVLGENDTLYTIFNDRAIYGNEKGVCVKDFRTKSEVVIERAGTTDLPVLGAFFDGKKYVIVYQEKAQTLKHFYVTDENGSVTEETKMTLGYNGQVENTYVNSVGDLYFTKVERTKDNVVVSATQTNVVESTKIELYRMKPDGSLSRQVGGEKLAYNIAIDDFFVSSEGDIFVQETDLQKGRTIQRFDCYGIRTATYNLGEESEGKYFCSGEELWLAYTDANGLLSLAPVNEDGVAETAQKISTEIGSNAKIVAGDGLYDVYISDDTAVYGVKISERTYEKVMEWTDADIDIEDRNCIGIMDGGDIYCLTVAEKEVIVLTETAPEEVPSDEMTVPEEDEDTDEEDSDEEDTDEDSDDEDSEDEDDDSDDEEDEDDEDEDEDAAEDTSDDLNAEPVQQQTVRTETYLKPIRLAKASETRLAELNSRRIITVAGDIYNSFNVYGEEYSIPELIKEFNRTNDQYFIHPKNYVKSDASAAEDMAKLEEEMKEGFTPDFIIYNPSDNDFTEYAEEGKFADFRELMSGDTEINEDDIMENIAELCTADGKMYRLFPFFTGKTFITTESAADSKSSWKISNYLDTAEVSNTVYTNEEDALDDILAAYVVSHTDYDSKSCTFDKPEFRNILKWADAFPSVAEAGGRSGDDYTSSKVYDVRFEALSTPARLNYEEAVLGEDQFVKGIPSSDEVILEVTLGITFSVLKTSDAKDASWQFIRQFFTDNFYSWGEKREFTEEQIKNRITFNELPVRTSVMEKLIDDSVSMKFEKLLYGDDYEPTYIAWGEEYELPAVSKSVAEKFRKAVNGKAYLSIRGSEYYSVIFEEAAKYFTDSEMTSEDASASVQRRALSSLLRTGTSGTSFSSGTEPEVTEYDEDEDYEEDEDLEDDEDFEDDEDEDEDEE